MSDNMNHLIGETDHLVWAEEFVGMVRREGITVDQDLMRTWFACAIQSGIEDGRARMESESITRLGLFSSFLATFTGAWDGNQPRWMPQPPEFLTIWRDLGILAVDSEGPVLRDQADAARRLVKAIDPDGKNADLAELCGIYEGKARLWEEDHPKGELTQVA